MSYVVRAQTLLCTALCWLSLCHTSSAVAAPPLEKHDWKTPGDRLILLDTHTHLKWLHLSQTVNLSVNDVMGQWFGNTETLPLAGAFAGFRYASEQEVAQLYSDFGISTIDNKFTTANWIGANIAFQALGLSGQNGLVSVQEAMVIHAPGIANAPEIVVDGLSARAFVVPSQSLTNFYTFDSKRNGLSSYLVMTTAVPEASSLTMLGSGLLLVIAANNRRRSPQKSNT